MKRIHKIILWSIDTSSLPRRILIDSKVFVTDINEVVIEDGAIVKLLNGKLAEGHYNHTSQQIEVLPI